MTLVHYCMKAITPISIPFVDKLRWSAAWILRSHLPWDYVCEIDIEDWLRDNCTGKYAITREQAFTNTFTIFIADKDDAIHFALRWINSEN